MKYYKQFDITNKFRKNFNNKLPFIIESLQPKNKTIDVYGDSFVELCELYSLSSRFDQDNVKYSWLWYLSQILGADIRCYGVSGSSEQLIYDIYKRTKENERDFIIIFHTTLTRVDHVSRYKYKRLTKKDYVEWDNQINCSCLHLYWTDKLYNFNNGISLRTRLYEKYSSDTCELTGMTANHMDINGNFIFAMKIVNIFKNKFKWEAWIE